MHHPVNIPLSFILDPAMIVDRKGRFLQCNPATFDQTGYDLQALQQMTAADLLHPADTRRARLELLKVIRNGQSRAFEGQIKSGPETYAWVRINAHLLSNTPGAET
ncbi:MAG: PAS domain-containing protein, partial [Leptospiraceae bacterium]|nr:PAS domain-containing protein [Leptospiraceae bacterium]